MKTKQKSVRVFEIISDDYDKVVNFIEKKGILLKRFLLTVKTNNEKIKEYFQNKPFEVRFVKAEFDGTNEPLEEEKEVKTEVKIIEKVVEKIVQKETNSTKTKIFDKIIRSGFEIRTENKLVFLNNINAGAKIYSNKEIEIFGEVFGTVICDGEYMIVKKSQKGTIIFNNTELPEIDRLSFISKDGIKEI
jgi:septum site-determining protein MinC